MSCYALFHSRGFDRRTARRTANIAPLRRPIARLVERRRRTCQSTIGGKTTLVAFLLNDGTLLKAMRLFRSPENDISQ